MYMILKAVISGVLIAVASQIARRYPGFGALIASLPLVSILGAIWLWRDKPDPINMADHLQATFWYVLPSLPMFLLMPAMLRSGASFWLTLLVGCAVTTGLYVAMTWAAPRFGIRM